MKKKVAIGLSGGVDSTMAAWLLLQEGYQVTGYTMKTMADSPIGEEARIAADWLGIDWKILDFTQRFEQDILSRFVDAYASGSTPSPCVWCNRNLKFGLLAEAMLSDGNDLVATGHYARLGRDNDMISLYRGADAIKDQSYFLAQVPFAQFEKVVFPLGDWQKSEVKKKMQELGAPVAERGESQDLCFLPQGNFADFILSRRPELARSGWIVDLQGKRLGNHEGAFRYTIGQRRGLGLGGGPWFVAKVDVPNNLVIVAHDGESQAKSCHLTGVQYAAGICGDDLSGSAQVRFRMMPKAAVWRSTGENEAVLEFAEPVSSITPGQLAVLYEADQVLASGWIS